MLLSSLMASVHYLAIGVGFGSVFMRGRYFKALADHPNDQDNIKRVFIADTAWGIAALLWLVSGLMRAFGGLEKGTTWYLLNPLFHIKMTLFVLVVVMELIPMIALIKLRIARKKDPTASLESKAWALYRKVNHYEAMVIFAMIFVASAMARGLWLMNNP